VTGAALPQWPQRKLAVPRNPLQPGQTPIANFEMSRSARSVGPGGAANQCRSSFNHLNRMVPQALDGKEAA
jgi:hypothetical protein